MARTARWSFCSKTSKQVFFFFGLLFAVFAGGILITVFGDYEPFKFIAIFQVIIGLGISFGEVVWNMYKRRNSWYTLTNRRALIASNMIISGRRLKSFQITENTVLDFEDGDLQTIWFAKDKLSYGNSTFIVKQGFERIKDGRDVYATMRKIQLRQL